MNHRDRIIQTLETLGVLDAMRWAVYSAGVRTLADFSEAAGHDARWAGMTRFILLEDRLDRVFSLGTYFVPEGADSAGMDVVMAELTQEEIASMPIIPPGTVKRANIHGSPGWSTGEHHFLIQSFQPGDIDTIRWDRKSKTKQAVARQPNPDMPGLFELPPSTHTAPAIEVEDDAPVLILAHSLNLINGNSELFLGLPSVGFGSNGAWHWHHALHGQHLSGRGTRIPIPHPLVSPNDVPDAPVRLRNQESVRNNLKEGGA